MKKKYTIGEFAKDLILILLTGGLWLIYIIIREIRAK